MGALFSYSVFTGIVLMAMYLVYKWMLAGERQHGYNRAVLWSVYTVAFAAYPVFAVLSGNESATMTDMDSIISEAVISDHGAVSPGVGETVMRFILWIYVVGMVAVVIRTVAVACRIATIVSRGRKSKVSGYTLVITDDDRVAPFSWLGYIVINSRDYEECANTILVHELQHQRQHHWIDLLVAQIVAVVEWYNPAAWLMLDEFKAVHEYQADECVISSGVNIRDYQMLLIRKAVGRRFPSLADSLSHGMLKKRIAMMYSVKATSRKRLKALMLVPGMAVALAVMNIPAVASVLSVSTETELSGSGNGVGVRDSSAIEINAAGISHEPVRVIGVGTKKKTDAENPTIVIRRTDRTIDSADPVIYVNGQRCDNIEDIDPSTIESISVDKSDSSIGVIYIQLKDK